MKDLKIITIKDILTVDRVELVPNFLPVTVELSGLKFLQADEVFINDISVPEFIVLSSTKILAQVPTSQRRSSIRKVSVLASRPFPDRRSLLRFEVGNIKGITGLERLVQHFTKILIQTPGSDSFNPTVGGGILSLVGTVVGRNDTVTLRSAIVSAVARTKDQIVIRQSKIPQIPPDERLLRADAIAVGFNPNTTTLAARISLGAVSGRDAVANLTF